MPFAGLADDSDDNDVILMGTSRNVPVLPQHLMQAAAIIDADALHIFPAKVVSVDGKPRASALPLSVEHCPGGKRKSMPAARLSCEDRSIAQAVLDLCEGRWISVWIPQFILFTF